MLWVKRYTKENFECQTPFQKEEGGMNRRRKKMNTQDNLSNFETELHIFSPHPLHCPSPMNTKRNKQKTHKKPEQTISLSRQLYVYIYIYIHAHPGRLSLLALLCPRPNKPPAKRPELLVQDLHGSAGRMHHPYRSVLGRGDDSDGTGVALPWLTAGDHQHRVVGLDYTLHSPHAERVVDATVYILPPIVHCAYWHPAKKMGGWGGGGGGGGPRGGRHGWRAQRGGGGGRVERSGRRRGMGVGGHDRERRKKKKKEVVLKVKQNTKQKRHQKKKKKTRKKEKKKHRKTVV